MTSISLLELLILLSPNKMMKSYLKHTNGGCWWFGGWASLCGVRVLGCITHNVVICTSVSQCPLVAAPGLVPVVQPVTRPQLHVLTRDICSLPGMSSCQAVCSTCTVTSLIPDISRWVVTHILYIYHSRTLTLSISVENQPTYGTRYLIYLIWQYSIDYIIRKDYDIRKVCIKYIWQAI